MALYVLAFLIGVIAGLRTMTAPAAVSWATHLGWLPLQNTLTRNAFASARAARISPSVSSACCQFSFASKFVRRRGCTGASCRGFGIAKVLKKRQLQLVVAATKRKRKLTKCGNIIWLYG
jgi:hypothetical protein